MDAQFHAVLESLARETAAARELESLLETESAELGAASPERIEALAARKMDLARRAAELARSRDDALARAGLPAGRRGLDLACAGGGAEGRRRLQAFLASAQRARLLNERVGAAVDLRLRHASAALGVLLRTGPDTAQVYSRDGRAHGAGVSRPLATA